MSADDVVTDRPEFVASTMRRLLIGHVGLRRGTNFVETTLRG